MEIFKKVLGLLGFFSIFYLLFIYDQAKAACPSSTAEVEDYGRPQITIPPTELEQMQYLENVMKGVTISKDPPLLPSPYSMAVLKDKYLHDVPRPDPVKVGNVTVNLPHHIPALVPLKMAPLFIFYFNFYADSGIDFKKMDPKHYDIFLRFIFELADM
jgi:hypothetical protein